MKRTHVYRVATANAIITESDNYRLAKTYMKEMGLESPQIAGELRLERGTVDDDGFMTFEVYEHLTIPKASPGEKRPLF